MKIIASGRKIDDLGRLVLPFEARQSLGLTPEAPVDILLDEFKGTILIREHVEQDTCLCCGGSRKLHRLSNGRCVCEDCFSAAPEALGGKQ
ncbi:MAG: hypothetical protein DBX44_05920 [Oscillospiraceae bacterium]|nr:MAG: hypothetical protein DBX44_05920 [Oscillospiraceae bacterium]